ncbi:MAG: UTP--glucose-1-phosphate uridylyltransferase [Clostridiales bacterium]|nr:UTP--glucose-1-phosphate uridylyltransferase [Clostridiales bacterium]
MQSIHKAVIPCGGMGTRFLPATKAIPKEILPVIDTPVLSFIADELISSGIDQIHIVLGTGKQAIKNYFTPSPRLEKALKNKPEMLQKLRDITKNAEITFSTQKYPRGSGDAVMHAKAFTGDDPFIMANGDDLFVCDVPAAKQLCEAYEKHNALVLGVQQVPETETDKYGIVDPKKIDGRFVWCNGMVEKPKSNPPSRYAAVGRYVLTPEVYEYITHVKKVNGEIGLTDAIYAMIKDDKVYAYELYGRRYDMGDKFGALTATVDFALKNPELKDKFAEYIKCAAEELR